LRKPCLHVHPGQEDAAQALRDFVADNEIDTLNVAGPRASKEPQVGKFVMKVLEAAFPAWRTSGDPMTLKDAAGIELPPPARKTIALEGRTIKDGVGKTVKDRHLALNELVKAIREFRKFTDQPLTLRGSEYAQFRNILREKCANIGMDQGHGHTARIISKARGPDLYPNCRCRFPRKMRPGIFQGQQETPGPWES
jgi:hypothetical protein